MLKHDSLHLEDLKHFSFACFERWLIIQTQSMKNIARKECLNDLTRVCVTNLLLFKKLKLWHKKSCAGKSLALQWHLQIGKQINLSTFQIAWTNDRFQSSFFQKLNVYLILFSVINILSLVIPFSTDVPAVISIPLCIFFLFSFFLLLSM